MIKIRLEGLPEETEKATSEIRLAFNVLSCSRPYQNRNSQYQRIYIDAELKKENKKHEKRK